METKIIVYKTTFAQRDGRPVKILAIEEIGSILWKRNGSYIIHAHQQDAERFIKLHIQRAVDEGIFKNWSKKYPDGKQILYGRRLRLTERQFPDYLARNLFRENRAEDWFEGERVFANTAENYERRIKELLKDHPEVQVKTRDPNRD